MGIAIILLTVIIRLIFYPLFYKSFKNQALLQKIQPELEKIQKMHADDKEKQAGAMLELYKTHKVNPFSSFFLILIQLPILIALYQVFLNGFSNGSLDLIYDFVNKPAAINHVFLGLIDLSKKSILIVALAAIFQYIQGILSMPKKKDGEPESQQRSIARKMAYIGPVLTVVVLSNLPAAVGLYWLTSSVFSVGQQWIINKTINQENNKLVN